MRFRALTLTGALTLGALPALGSVAPGSPVAEPRVHEIGFKRTGGMGGRLMVVSAKIDGKPTNLLFDTGAGYPLILDRSVAKARGYKGTLKLGVHGVGKGSLRLTHVRSLQFGDWTSGPIPAGIMSLGMIRLSTGLTGARIDGIIGMPIFAQFRKFRIDFAASTIQFVEYAAGEKPPARIQRQLRDLRRDARAVKKMLDGTGGALGVDVVGHRSEDVTGLRVQGVRPGNAAARAGIREGDVITHLDGKRLGRRPRDLTLGVARAGAGGTVTLTLRRDGTERELRVVVGAWPDGTPAPPKPVEPDGEDF